MLTPKFKKLFQFLNTVFLIYNNDKLTSQLVAVAVLDDLFGRIVLPLLIRSLYKFFKEFYK